jgi:hypothetical protein
MSSRSADRTGDSDSPNEIRLPRKWQLAIFVAVVWHLTGVFIEPFHFFSRSEVQFAADTTAIRSIWRPYTQWLYLDHGYFFFAPNPGPGHLLRVIASEDPIPAESTAELDPGWSVTQWPDRNRQWPRLLYHRYFMLSEFYYSRYAPVTITEDLQRDREFVDRWKSDRRLYTTIQDSVVLYAKQKTGKPFVKLERLERELPSPVQVHQERLRLSEPRFLRALSESMDEPIREPAEDRLPIPNTAPSTSSNKPPSQASQ